MKLLLTAALLALTLTYAIKTNAQGVFYPDAKSQALGGASVGLAGAWSVFGNQAGLAGIKSPKIGGSFQNRFLVSELSTRAGLFVFPVQSSVFAFSLSQFGRIPFREEKIGLSYARAIFPKLNFGVQFNYYRLFLPEDNRSAGSAGLELGIQYLHSKKLVLGLHVQNPYQTGIKTLSRSYNYPSRVNFGALYHLSDSFSFASGLENDFGRHIGAKAGLEYVVLEKLFLRAGISGKPYQLSSGIGFRIQKLTLDVASSYNQYLGSSPAVSFQYQF